LRDHPDNPNATFLREAASKLEFLLSRLQEPAQIEIVRGHEGEAARIYFGVFDHLIIAQKEEFFFRERNRRPPLDNMNSLLSFLYVLLTM
jgi:CRISPR-associated protein Cas1